MAGTGKSQTSPARIEVDEKQIAALNLRKAGATFQEIADELGYASPSGAYEAVQSALKKAISEPAEELRHLELARLDEMQAAVWEAVQAGDPDAIGSVLRIMGHRMKLLGLERRDSPIKIKLPKITSVEAAQQAIADMAEQITDAELSPSDAVQVGNVIQSYLKVAELTEISEKIKKLEALCGDELERAK